MPSRKVFAYVLCAVCFISVVSIILLIWVISPLLPTVNEEVKKHSKSFIQQAKTQYGDDAVVVNIRAEKRIVNISSVSFDFKIITTPDVLKGAVCVDDEEFEVMYIASENEIVSYRNYDAIISSLTEFFKDFNILNGGSIINDAYKITYLPDNITTFKDFIMYEKNTVHVAICVTNSLINFTEEDFSELKILLEQSAVYAKFKIYQVDDQETADILNEFAHSIKFDSVNSYPRCDEIINGTDENGYIFADVFDYFNIRSTVYIKTETSVNSEGEKYVKEIEFGVQTPKEIKH
ncbi:MAG: hypothetical protein FWF82_05265 [Oscillospiraceae bacterium]|nr:hypothetical protein [Oscillospiraceae bacterium]